MSIESDTPAASPPRSPTPWLWPLIAGLVIALVGGGVGALVATRLAAPASGCDTVRVAANVLPSVVTVFATAANGQGGSCSGAIASDGVIVTNDHVIHDAGATGEITVLLNSGEMLPATLVGTDPITDLAVLSVARTGLPSLPLDARVSVVVGQPVVALGAPLGLSGTVTSGIVSALDRNVPVPTGAGGTTLLVGSIQTDAAINPGNSGGPLVSCAGQLVGVNTAGATVPTAGGDTGGGSVGLNFAVPAATASRIVAELRATGKASHPWIGVSTAEVDAALAARSGLPTGLFVQEVTAGSPAAQAGLARGDVITRLGGQPATAVAKAWLLASASVCYGVDLDFVREGRTQTATLTLAEQP